MPGSPVPIPKDATVDRAVPIPAGSVFDTPTTPPTAAELPGRLKQAGRKMAEFGVGTALPIAADVATEGAGPAVKIGAQAAAGFAQPYAEAAVSKLTGGHPEMPSIGQAARSAAFMAGLTGLGMVPKAGKAASVEKQIRALPERAQTTGNVDAALRLRDYWIKGGATPEQADQIVTLPAADLEALNNQSVQAGRNYREAFQKVLDHQRGDFKNRYEAVLGQYGDSKVDAVPIGQSFEQFGQGEGQHELTPTFRAFLQRKGLELTKAGETGGPSVGGVPWKQLPEKLKAQLKQQGAEQGVIAPPGEMTVNDLRKLRTELRENVPASATPLDRQAAQRLNNELTQTIDQKLADAGAKPEQIAAMHALDDEYGRFADTVKKLDPRSGKFGSQIADLLFDKQMKNPEQAVNFIRMAQAAEKAHPGEVMPQLREALMEKWLAETKQAAQGRPVEEMRLIQNLQRQWGSDKNAHAVLGAVFGQDSPMANVTEASKILGRLTAPDAVAEEAAKKTGLQRFMIRVPGWLVNLGGAYALYGLATGSMTGPWTDMRKNPARFATGMIAMMSGISFASKIMSSTDNALKREYVNFLLDPNEKNISKFATRMSAAASAGANLPNDASANP